MSDTNSPDIFNRDVRVEGFLEVSSHGIRLDKPNGQDALVTVDDDGNLLLDGTVQVGQGVAKSYVDARLLDKADAADIVGMATTADVGELNASLTAALADKANASALALKLDAAQKGAAGGVPVLGDDKLIKPEFLPLHGAPSIADVAGLTAALAAKAEASALAGKANTSHTHTIGQVTGLSQALSDKADNTLTNQSLTSAQQAIAALQTGLSDLQSEFESGTGNTGDLAARLDEILSPSTGRLPAVELAAANNSSRLGAAETGIASLVSRANASDTKHGQQDAAIAALQSAAGVTQSYVDTAISAVTTKNTQQDNTLSDHSGRLTTAEGHIADLLAGGGTTDGATRAYVDDANAAQDSIIGGHTTQLSALDGRLGSAESTLSGLSVWRSAKDLADNQRDQDISDLQAATPGGTLVNKDYVDAANSTQNSTIGALQSTVGGHTSQLSTLTSSLTSETSARVAADTSHSNTLAIHTDALAEVDTRLTTNTADIAALQAGGGGGELEDVSARLAVARIEAALAGPQLTGAIASGQTSSDPVTGPDSHFVVVGGSVLVNPAPDVELVVHFTSPGGDGALNVGTATVPAGEGAASLVPGGLSGPDLAAGATVTATITAGGESFDGEVDFTVTTILGAGQTSVVLSNAATIPAGVPFVPIQELGSVSPNMHVEFDSFFVSTTDGSLMPQATYSLLQAPSSTVLASNTVSDDTTHSFSLADTPLSFTGGNVRFAVDAPLGTAVSAAYDVKVTGTPQELLTLLAGIASYSQSSIAALRDVVSSLPTGGSSGGAEADPNTVILRIPGALSAGAQSAPVTQTLPYMTLNTPQEIADNLQFSFGTYPYEADGFTPQTIELVIEGATNYDAPDTWQPLMTVSVVPAPFGPGSEGYIKTITTTGNWYSGWASDHYRVTCTSDNPAGADMRVALSTPHLTAGNIHGLAAAVAAYKGGAFSTLPDVLTDIAARLAALEV